MAALSWQRLFGPRMATIPALDGGFRPNQRLDLCRMVDRGLSAPEDVCVDRSGRPIVSEARRLVTISGSWYAPMRQVVATFDGDAGAMAQTDADGLLVAIDGRKIVGKGGDVDGLVIEEIDGRPLRGITAMAVLPRRRLAICEGSSVHGLDDWTRDLLSRGATGRVTIVDLGSRRGTTVADGLAWPYGVTGDGDDLLVTESWRHRLLRFQAKDGGWGKAEIAADHLPGYPARIVPSVDRGYWLSFIGVRSQLVEYVIAHRKFCGRMIDEIDPNYWIAPSLAATDDPLEPMQLGGIKQGGVKKPWAPPRSYGLVARLDADFQIVESLHSRQDCKRHGITGLRERDGTLFIVSKGHGKLLMHREEP